MNFKWIVAATCGVVGILGCVTQASESVVPVAKDLPDIGLSGPLLYQIMAAEVAAQRGELGSAYVTFLSLARQTRDPRLAQRAVEVAISGRAWSQAIESARLWRELAPQSGDAGHTLGALLVAGNQMDAAVPVYESLAVSDPVRSLAALQRVLAQAADKAAGFALLDRLARPYVEGDAATASQVRMILATAARAAGQPTRAAEDASAAYELRPDHERTAIAVAQFYVSADADADPAKSGAARAKGLALLAGFLQRQPKALEARLTYARLLVADNQLLAAQREFDGVLKQEDSNLDALYALGVLALEGPPPHHVARHHLTRYLDVLARNPDAQREAAPAYLNLARISEGERNYPEALSWLRRVDSGPQQLTARAREAIVLGRLKRVDEARKLIAATPASNDEERAQLVQAEGQLLRDAGRYRDAYDLLSAALAKSPDNAALLYDTAMVAERLNRIDTLEKHLRRLIELQPDYAHGYNALGYTLADRNLRLDEAMTLIERAHALAPNDASIIDSLGWVQFRRGNLTQARHHLERAFQLRPDGDIGAHLGEVLWTMGEHAAARAVWRRARNAEPESEALRDTLARIKVRL